MKPFPLNSIYITTLDRKLLDRLLSLDLLTILPNALYVAGFDPTPAALQPLHHPFLRQPFWSEPRPANMIHVNSPRAFEPNTNLTPLVCRSVCLVFPILDQRSRAEIDVILFIMEGGTGVGCRYNPAIKRQRAVRAYYTKLA
jgi:hypothetical protein